jgi:hypothetical protein
MTKKSEYAVAVDEIKRALRPFLSEGGFRVRGRTFNRQTEDGLTQVVNLQMGRFQPPGTVFLPGLRENLYGAFTVNLGVYVPEVEKYAGFEAKSWVTQSHCCVWQRLAQACGEDEIWWRASASEEVIAEVLERLQSGGLAFLERFSTRDRILSELDGRSRTDELARPRIVAAVILAVRGDEERARSLLSQQARETDHPPHREYCGELAAALGLGGLAL